MTLRTAETTAVEVQRYYLCLSNVFTRRKFCAREFEKVITKRSPLAVPVARLNGTGDVITQWLWPRLCHGWQAFARRPVFLVQANVRDRYYRFVKPRARSNCAIPGAVCFRGCGDSSAFGSLAEHVSNCQWRMWLAHRVA